ncbi:Unknown protein sequence [Pseudomonas amygdali pv. morsprunorum]|nr:Unknown protein sequence [Pseudomonas amygdali pv. morsprunorum]
MEISADGSLRKDGHFTYNRPLVKYAARVLFRLAIALDQKRPPGGQHFQSVVTLRHTWRTGES